MKASPSNLYKNYEIYKDRTTGKYGVRNTLTDRLIIKCIFDRIDLYRAAALFLFELNGREAVYKADDICKLLMR